MMSTMVRINLEDIRPLSLKALTHAGYGAAHARAIADMLYTCQLDDCQSHGLFRLFMCVKTMQAGKIDGHAEPAVEGTCLGCAVIGAHAHRVALAGEGITLGDERRPVVGVGGGPLGRPLDGARISGPRGRRYEASVGVAVLGVGVALGE